LAASYRTRFNNADAFDKALLLSLGAHVLFLLFVILKSVIVPQKPAIDLSQAISVSISNVVPGKLPEKVQPAPAPEVIAEPVSEPAPEPKEEPAPTPAPVPIPAPAKEKSVPKVPEKIPSKANEINLKKTKQKQLQALDKIKQMSAMEQIKQDVKNDALKSLAKAEKAEAARANRIIKPGTPLSGLDKIEADEYLQSLDAQIKQAWTLPQWLASQKKLRAQVLVKFNRAGQLQSAQIASSSGNTTYDNYCVQAATAAAPFPKVPEKFSEKFSIDGLVIGFPE
jgi:TonB family protein